MCNVSQGRHPGVLLEQPQERDERPTESLLRDGGGAQVYFKNKIFSLCTYVYKGSPCVVTAADKSPLSDGAAPAALQR